MTLNRFCIYCSAHLGLKPKCVCNDAIKADYDAYVKEQTDKLKGDMMRDLRLTDESDERGDNLFFDFGSRIGGYVHIIPHTHPDSNGLYIDVRQVKKLRDHLNEFLGEDKVTIPDYIETPEGLKVLNDSIEKMTDTQYVPSKALTEKVGVHGRRIEELEKKLTPGSRGIYHTWLCMNTTGSCLGCRK